MHIQNINSTPKTKFGARALAKTQIKQQIPFTPFYKKVNAYFVELNSKEDIKSFNKYALKYNDGPTTEAIAVNLKIHSKHSKTYALTTQSDKFEHLEPEKIIGACDGTFIPSIYRANGKFCVDNLEAQSKRNLMARHKTMSFNLLGVQVKIPLKRKGIGTEIMKRLIEHLHGEPVDKVEVLSLPQAMPFYRTLNKWNNEQDCFTLERKNFLAFANN